MSRMRLALPVAALLALAACGGEPEEAGEEPAPAQVEADVVRLTGEGLSAGGEAFYFNSGRGEVETALAKVLGEPNRGATNTECGAGPVDFTDFDGGLTLNFQDGALVGWNWHLPYEGDAPTAQNVALASGETLGASRASIEGREGFALVEDSTLGEEFTLAGGIGGFIEEDEVSMLYAGTQCFFR